MEDGFIQRVVLKCLHEYSEAFFPSRNVLSTDIAGQFISTMLKIIRIPVRPEPVEGSLMWFDTPTTNRDIPIAPGISHCRVIYYTMTHPFTGRLKGVLPWPKDLILDIFQTAFSNSNDTFFLSQGKLSFSQSPMKYS